MIFVNVSKFLRDGKNVMPGALTLTIRVRQSAQT